MSKDWFQATKFPRDFREILESRIFKYYYLYIQNDQWVILCPDYLNPKGTRNLFSLRLKRNFFSLSKLCVWKRNAPWITLPNVATSVSPVTQSRFSQVKSYSFGREIKLTRLYVRDRTFLSVNLKSCSMQQLLYRESEIRNLFFFYFFLSSKDYRRM